MQDNYFFGEVKHDAAIHMQVAKRIESEQIYHLYLLTNGQWAIYENRTCIALYDNMAEAYIFYENLETGFWPSEIEDALIYVLAKLAEVNH
jgi:hypothetical protein